MSYHSEQVSYFVWVSCSLGRRCKGPRHSGKWWGPRRLSIFLSRNLQAFFWSQNEFSSLNRELSNKNKWNTHTFSLSLFLYLLITFLNISILLQFKFGAFWKVNKSVSKKIKFQPKMFSSINAEQIRQIRQIHKNMICQNF